MCHSVNLYRYERCPDGLRNLGTIGETQRHSLTLILYGRVDALMPWGWTLAEQSMAGVGVIVRTRKVRAFTVSQRAEIP